MKVLTHLLTGLILAGVLLACTPAIPPTSPPQAVTPSATALPPSATPVPPTPTLTPSPPPTATPTPDIPRWPLFQRGDWGQPEVFALQRLLRYHGFSIIADGKFGGQTRNAVIDFQAQHGLPADGLVGPVTWSALVQDLVVQEGQDGDAVRAIQYLLQYKFGYSLEVDGVFGPETTDAIKDFQASSKLIPDGLVDPQTWQALVAITP